MIADKGIKEHSEKKNKQGEETDLFWIGGERKFKLNHACSSKVLEAGKHQEGGNIEGAGQSFHDWIIGTDVRFLFFFNWSC